MADIKTKPTMDKPKALNRDFVPKEAGSIWKAHHDQQEAQRGPKERGSVQYATDQVETTGRRSALAAADGGRRAVRQIKKRYDRAEPVRQEKTATEPKKNNPSAEGAYQSSPYDSSYPSARRDGTRQTAEQRRVELGRQKAVEDHFGSASSPEIHSSFEVTRPRTGQSDVHPPHSPQSAPLEQGRKKAVRDAVKKRQAAQHILDGHGATSRVKQAAATPTKVGRPQIKTRQSRPEAAVHRQRTVKTIVSEKGTEPIQGAAAKAMQKARQTVQRRLQRKMAMQSAGSTQRGVRQLGQWAAAAAKAIVHTVKAAASGLFVAGGGVVVLILLLLLIMVGAIAASPFGILFSNESSTPDAVPMSAAIAQVNYDFNAQLEALQGADAYDDVTIAGEMADWVDVLVIFAVKTAGSNDVDATDVVTMDADRMNRLKAVFSDMNIITSTGTYRPYGLDCSGFVDWVFYNAMDGGYIIGHGGGVASQHNYCTATSWADALPGDLVFYPNDTHVGTVAGWDESGNVLIVHCTSGYNNVVITDKEGFVSIGRPLYFAE